MQSARLWRVVVPNDVESGIPARFGRLAVPCKVREPPGKMHGPEKKPKDEMIDAVQDNPVSRTSPVPTELKELLEFPGVLSLAADLPAAELFPMSAVAQASARLLADPGTQEQLGTPFQPLKTQIVELMAMR